MKPLVRTALLVTASWTVGLSPPAHANWPDPDRRGTQQLQGVQSAGGISATRGGAELLANRIAGKRVDKVLTDEKLRKRVGDQYSHDIDAELCFAVKVNQLYVFDAGNDFTGAATREHLGGSQFSGRTTLADGTIVLGVDYLDHLRKNSGELWPIARAVMVYHEVAHVYAMKRGWNGTGPAAEAFADRLGGYCLGRNAKLLTAVTGIAVNSATVKRLAMLRAFVGKSSASHGPPAVRVDRILDGYFEGRAGRELDLVTNGYEPLAD